MTIKQRIISLHESDPNLSYPQIAVAANTTNEYVHQVLGRPRCNHSTKGCDRFGVWLGTKKAKAVEMYASGATTKEVKQALGNPFHALLHTLEKEGHLVKRENKTTPINNAFITLVHKDDLAKTE